MREKIKIYVLKDEKEKKSKEERKRNEQGKRNGDETTTNF